MHVLMALALAMAPAALAATPSGAAPPVARATPPAAASFLIVNPSGRGNQSLADGFLSDLAQAVIAHWPADEPAPALTGRYHVTVADALASIRREAPAFAIVSPGFYLAQRETLGLVPMLVPVRAHDGPPVVHLVVPASAPARDPAAMRLGGQLAGEPAWVVGPVLRLPPGARPTFVPAARTLESVRQLEAGAVDGILLPDADWALLQQTGKARGLRIARTSPPLPEGPVVSLGPPSSTARAAAAALRALGDDEASRRILERMTLRGFREATPTDYAEVIAPGPTAGDPRP